MKPLFDKLKFWQRSNSNAGTDISVCVEMRSTNSDASSHQQGIFKLTHIQAQQLDRPDKIIAEWLSQNDTEMVLYFKRTPHQQTSHTNKENYHGNP